MEAIRTAPQIPKKWHAYKLVSNYHVDNIHVNHTARTIEYNLHFISNITQNQLTFLLDWCIRHKRTKDLLICDEKTMDACLKKGIKKAEIISLFKTMKIINKPDRLFYLMTDDAEKIETRKPFLYLWTKLTKLFQTLEV